jgi:hypothetical protein
MRLPHRVRAVILLTYPEASEGDRLEAKVRATLGTKGPRWELVLDSDRPPLKERIGGTRLFKALEAVAADHGLTLKRETSAWPSVAGLVPAKTAALCGVAPATRDRGTPSEAVQRISLIQRTLMLADYLARQLER